MTLLTMSKREVDRYQILSRLLRQEINGSQAAELLRLSVRQIKRLKKRVRERGASGLIHGHRGQPGNRRLPEEERERIVSFLRNR